MCHQSAPFVSCYSNRCQYQAACYVSCKRLSENHTGCITIAADNGKRKVEPRFRRASVSGHGTLLLFSLVKIDIKSGPKILFKPAKQAFVRAAGRICSRSELPE